jgi:Hypothetical protein (DUF2513)
MADVAVEVGMKRNMELIRDILLRVEADPKLDGADFRRATAETLGITERTEAEVAYHLDLLIQAGFLNGNTKMLGRGDQKLTRISKLTWEGHEFLDDIRDPEIWRKTKDREKAVAGVGLKFIWEIAKAEIKTTLGLP